MDTENKATGENTVQHTCTWREQCSRCLALKCVAIVLRGAGQVMFQNSPLTGLLFFAGVFWGAYAADMPAVAWGALVGNVCATASARLLGAPQEDIAAGLHGFNGMLVGCALPTFFAPTPLLWGYLLAGAVFSAVMTLTLSRFLRTWRVSAMTGPFVLTTWLLMLAAYSFAHINITTLPHPALSLHAPVPGSIDPAQYARACLTGVSQVFLLDNAVTGGLFLVGLALCSPMAALFALGGSCLAVSTALILGADTSSIVSGLYQFSAVLTAIGLGTAFYRPSGLVALYALLGVIFTVIIQGALNVALHVYGIPTLTFPFVLAAWIFLLPHVDFNRQPVADKDA